jgi:hypothetical protein
VLNAPPEEQKKFENKPQIEKREAFGRENKDSFSSLKPDKLSYSFHFSSPTPQSTHRLSEKPKIFDMSSVPNTKSEKIKHHDLQVFLLSQNENNKEKAQNILKKEKNCFKQMDSLIQREIDLQEKSLLDRIEFRKRTISLFDKREEELNWKPGEWLKNVGDNGRKDNRGMSELAQLWPNDRCITEECLKNNGKNINGAISELPQRWIKDRGLAEECLKNVAADVGKKDLPREAHKLPKDRENNEKQGAREVQALVEKYDKEIEKLRMSLKNKESSLLIKNILARKEKEREELIKEKQGKN